MKSAAHPDAGAWRKQQRDQSAKEAAENEEYTAIAKFNFDAAANAQVAADDDEWQWRKNWPLTALFA